MLQKHTSSVAVFDENKKNFVGFVDVLDVATIVFLLAFTDSIKGVLGPVEPTYDDFSKKELQVPKNKKEKSLRKNNCFF